ncbi:hypothetical protein PEX1_081940 [Penicillium expansum]|uniref:Uncharacterized protein n=1 Tax=Penicillium expansum TaxID=27334 RepID=A0A0A2IAL7_PENEN|nr:hypothetical protein PEX2_005340 [Penicillium expansum]KGO39456.1 hypothetical protein PEXP_042970 [Penicillium expansum]KGO50055.1 hypothetical protein PEX1_081940 [Penicillium expansum]KGO55812.1 hypothetical protein PEX2_005340 [Penicillium expansum]
MAFKPANGLKGASGPYTVLEEPLGSTRHVKIITIGAGASGLNMIRTLRNNLLNTENVVYEKNPDIGGTWYENGYPGCQCDIPSHNYQFSWATNPHWSKFYSEAREIHRYLKDLAARENLNNVIKLHHQVKHAEWNEDEGLWLVRVRDLTTDIVKTDSAHFLLDGSGILNNWKWPDIPGLHTFKDVETLVHFVRSPIWVAPAGVERMAQSTAGEVVSELELDGDRFTTAQMSKFETDKELYNRFIKATEEVVNNKFSFLVTSSPLADVVKGEMTEYMTQALKDNQALIDKLIPDFPFGCRRITPSSAYLKAFHKDNVQIVTEGIAKIYENGLITDQGQNIEVDAIVCATGFNVSFCPRFPIIGREGNLQDIWTRELPSSYMSLAVPSMPNYFIFLGPNAPIGHGSVLTITENVGKYITRIIRKCQEECIKSISPRQDVVEEFAEHIAAFMPRTAWAGNCSSWFKNGKKVGPVTALHPGSRIHWFHMLQNFRGEDFEFTHWSKNRFRYLGNGFSTLEAEGMNSTWYLDDPDKML